MPDNTNSEKGKAKPVTYSRERLIEEAEDFFGYPPHVVAGALALDSKQNFTRDEVASAIDKWLKAEVK